MFVFIHKLPFVGSWCDDLYSIHVRKYNTSEIGTHRYLIAFHYEFMLSLHIMTSICTSTALNTVDI